jgi:hypothetical protein
MTQVPQDQRGLVLASLMAKGGREAAGGKHGQGTVGKPPKPR